MDRHLNGGDEQARRTGILLLRKEEDVLEVRLRPGMRICEQTVLFPGADVGTCMVLCASAGSG